MADDLKQSQRQALRAAKAFDLALKAAELRFVLDSTHSNSSAQSEISEKSGPSKIVVRKALSGIEIGHIELDVDKDVFATITKKLEHMVRSKKESNPLIKSCSVVKMISAIDDISICLPTDDRTKMVNLLREKGEVRVVESTYREKDYEDLNLGLTSEETAKLMRWKAPPHDYAAYHEKDKELTIDQMIDLLRRGVDADAYVAYREKDKELRTSHMADLITQGVDADAYFEHRSAFHEKNKQLRTSDIMYLIKRGVKADFYGACREVDEQVHISDVFGLIQNKESAALHSYGAYYTKRKGLSVLEMAIAKRTKN